MLVWMKRHITQLFLCDSIVHNLWWCRMVWGLSTGPGFDIAWFSSLSSERLCIFGIHVLSAVTLETCTGRWIHSLTYPFFYLSLSSKKNLHPHSPHRGVLPIPALILIIHSHSLTLPAKYVCIPTVTVWISEIFFVVQKSNHFQIQSLIKCQSHTIHYNCSKCFR